MLRWAISWLAIFAIGLAPMLVYFVAGVIGRAIRGKIRPIGSRQADVKKPQPGGSRPKVMVRHSHQ